MGKLLSAELYDLLNGKDIRTKQHEVMMLLTVAEDGWPHIAMISVGEIIICEDKIRLSLWPNTKTTGNIIRTSKATLVVILEGIATYIKLSLEQLPLLKNAKHPLTRFSAVVETVKEDVAIYADITSGVKIKLKEPDSVIERWEETIQELVK